MTKNKEGGNHRQIWYQIWCFFEKIIKKFEISQHQRYFNTFTGAHSLKDKLLVFGDAHKRDYKLQVEHGKQTGLSAKQGMLRIKKLKEDAEVEVKDEKKDQKAKQQQQPKEQKEQNQPNNKVQRANNNKEEIKESTSKKQ